MQFAEINNITLHYQLLSAPAGKPVLVFINSLGTDFRIWRDVIVDLAGEFAMVAYDKRGHGLSSSGSTPYSMDDHVDDLEALLSHLGLQKVILCGVSVGGMIAQGLAARRPEIVSGLVLCDTGHKIGSQDMWNDRIEMIETGGIEDLADVILERWFSPEFHEEKPAELMGYHNMLIRQPVEGYTGTCAAIRDADFTEAATRIAVPTLCVVGDQDGSTPPELVRELSELIAGADFEIIKGAGHLPSIEQPEALSDLIRKFVAKMLNAEVGSGNPRQLH